MLTKTNCCLNQFILIGKNALCWTYKHISIVDVAPHCWDMFLRTSDLVIRTKERPKDHCLHRRNLSTIKRSI